LRGERFSSFPSNKSFFLFLFPPDSSVLLSCRVLFFLLLFTHNGLSARLSKVVVSSCSTQEPRAFGSFAAPVAVLSPPWGALIFSKSSVFLEAVVPRLISTFPGLLICIGLTCACFFFFYWRCSLETFFYAGLTERLGERLGFFFLLVPFLASRVVLSSPQSSCCLAKELLLLVPSPGARDFFSLRCFTGLTRLPLLCSDLECIV